MGQVPLAVLKLQVSHERILGLLKVAEWLLGICTCKAQLPRYTMATAYYGEKPKGTNTMGFAEKLPINLVFPDVWEGKHKN